MGKITKLPKEVVERISAGEVIERPVSIFKELIENSIDANANKIFVNVFKGGKEKIIVEDDGDGIIFDDLSKLFIRFSTSKIKSVDDIEKISTLGFRGEALASIAAISHISIFSKSKSWNIGGFIEASFGQVQSPKMTNCDFGTHITVENIFDNFPARKRFLKSADVEFYHILNWLKAFSLAFYQIDFHFFKDDQPYYILKKTNSVTERIESIYGKEVMNDIEFLNFGDDGLNILIYFNRNPYTVTDSFNYIFVNKRYVRNMQLSYILRQSITGFLPESGKFLYIIFIETDPRNLDVNVHPAKIEVKFRNFSVISDLIVKNLRGYFERTATSISLDNPLNTVTQIFSHTTNAKIFEGKQEVTSAISLNQKTFFDSSIKFVTQLFNSYILIQNQNHIAIYDQHALSERILLTRLINEATNKKISVQNLSIPQFVEVYVEIVEWLKKTADMWQECGFDFEIVTPTKIKVNGLPVQFSNFTSSQLHEAFGKAFSISQKEMDKKELYYHLLKEFACKNAIKQGDILTKEDMLELVQTAEKEGLYTCIHGRPVKLVLSLATLEKFFQRT